MKTLSNQRNQESGEKANANSTPPKTAKGLASPATVVDNRPGTSAQRKLRDIIQNSPQAKRAAQLQAMTNKPTKSSRATPEEEELLQGKFERAQGQPETPNPAPAEANDTGLPDSIKSGIEQLSGYSMDDTKVHYNSPKPMDLQAHAYAQGTDIHLAPGQEKHLPHEAWHVVQQKEGRVKPTTQVKGINVNDQSALEKEADVMGSKAMDLGIQNKPAVGGGAPRTAPPASATIQRKSVPGVAGYGNFSDLGNGQFGTTQPTDANEVTGLVNEIRTKASAVGIHQNIKVLTGTHGDTSGNLVGETMFYNEDLAHEGHKVGEGGWINVLNVKGKSKDTIGGWMEPGSSAVILAWCYSKTSSERWADVHSYKTGADYQSDNKVW